MWRGTSGEKQRHYASEGRWEGQNAQEKGLDCRMLSSQSIHSVGHLSARAPKLNGQRNHNAISASDRRLNSKMSILFLENVEIRATPPER